MQGIKIAKTHKIFDKKWFKFHFNEPRFCASKLDECAEMIFGTPSLDYQHSSQAAIFANKKQY